jgi:hypothetical protein
MCEVRLCNGAFAVTPPTNRRNWKNKEPETQRSGSRGAQSERRRLAATTDGHELDHGPQPVLESLASRIQSQLSPSTVVSSNMLGGPVSTLTYLSSSWVGKGSRRPGVFKLAERTSSTHFSEL